MVEAQCVAEVVPELDYGGSKGPIPEVPHPRF